MNNYPIHYAIKAMYNKTCYNRLSRLMTLFVIAMLVFSKADAQTTWYQDYDNDDWGNPSISQIASSKPSGYVRNNFDCDDSTYNGLEHPYEGPQFISDAKAGFFDMAMADNGTIYIAYVDKGVSSKVTVKKKSGNGWVLVGSAGFTPNAAKELSLAIDHNNMPYVAYNNASYQDVRVMKYNGSSWDSVGSMIALDGRSPDIAIDPNNVPYIVYGELWDHPIVQKYNGSNWVTIGTLGGGQFWSVSSIAIDNAGAVYVVFKEYGPYALNVMKYNGSSWSVLDGSLSSSSRYADIVIDGNNVPYVILAESGGGIGYPTRVVKYDSANWVGLGGHFGESYYGSLAIDKDGTPYVFYSRSSYNGVGMVQKYSGGGWPAVGPGIISGDRFYAQYTRIVIDSLGILHLGYLDNYASDDSVSVKTIAPIINNASTPTISGNTNIRCGGTTTLSITGGNLNAAAKWKWYTGSCGGTLIDSGTSITVSPTSTTTYYARGEGGCSKAPGTCGSITVNFSKYQWYADADNDGWGNPAKDSLSCTKPAGYVLNNLDCKDSVANGSVWGNVGSVAFSAGQATEVKMATDTSGVPYVVYKDYVNGSKATVMKYNGSTWVAVGNPGFTATDVWNVDIAFSSNNTPYISWTSQTNQSLNVMKFDGNSWVNVGTNPVSSGGAYSVLAFDGNNMPYVAFYDYTLSSTDITVKKYNGSAWITVGAAGITGISPDPMHFAISGDGTPYIAYTNSNAGRFITVKKYNGSSWVTVGAPDFSSGGVYELKIAVNNDGTPYAAFKDANDKAAVMRYDGNSWVSVGNASITQFYITGIDIAIDAAGTPYITYSNETGSNYKADVLKYVGNSWVNAGNATFSAGQADYPVLAIDNKGVPYVAYTDYAQNSKAAVMKLSPQSLGNPAKPALATSDTVLCGGGTATLSIQSGNLNDAGQWHWYSGSCAGTAVGTGTSIQVSPATTTTYYARGEGGCTTTPGACDSIVIKFYADPVVTTNPVDSTLCNGGIATFKVVATGNNLSYQWQVNAGAGYTDVSNNTIYSGATAATGVLQITGATTAMSGYKYRCVVTNLCTKKDTSNEATLTIHPIPTVNTVTDKVVCNGAATTAITFSGAVNGTNYSWINTNTSIGLAANGSGNIASFAAVNNTTAPVTATIIVTPSASGCIGMSDTFAITVNPTPTVVATSGYQTCEGAAMGPFSFSGSVTGTVFNWTNNNTAIGLSANGTGDISTFTTMNGTLIAQTGTIIVTPVANGCTGTKDTFNIIVDPMPVIQATPDMVLCNGAAMSATFNSNLSNTVYIWSNNTPSIGLAANGFGNITSLIATNSSTTPVVATVIVTPAANACPGTNDTFTITVNPTPNVVATADKVLCNGATINAINFNGSVSATTYGWVNNATSIGLAASGTGNIAPFAVANNGTAPVTATVIVTPTAYGCSGTKDTFTIKVNPTPNVLATSDKTACNNGSISAINFIGDVVGTTFSWTNDITSIGLASSGSNNIASFVATNTGIAPVTSTVIVIPAANGCIGMNDTFAINVNPTPTVNATTDMVLCNGAPASATFTGAVSGTAYNWTNNTPAIGIAASGTGSIGSFMTSNTTSAPLISTIIVTPVANGCSGMRDTFNITVNPTPNVAAVSNQAVCNSAATTAVNFSGDVLGTAYAWVNNTTSINLAASGSGSIPSFNATNSSNTPVTATVTVTPSANGCIGPQGIFTITVNPTPTVDAVSDQSLCHGTMTNMVTFTGAVNGTVYDWTNNISSIGLAAAGTGNIASFTAKNMGAAPVIATITVTPTANNCTGLAGSFNIAANPIPNVVAVSNQTLCNDAATTDVNFSGNVTGTLYSWTNTNALIGLAATGTGNIASFNAMNTSVAPIKGTIVVTPSANNCTGLSESFDITVNPTPKLSSTLTPSAICANTEFDYAPNSQTSNTVFPWVRIPVAGIIPTTASGGNSISEKLGNTTIAEIDVKYVYTLEANGCVNKDTVTVAVQPTPEIPTIETKTLGSVCRNTLFQNFSAEHPQPAGVEYTWTANNAIIWASGSDNRTSLINFINEGRVLVKLTANVTGFTCTASDSFEVVVNGNSTSIIPTVAYYNKRFICLDNSVDGYQWGYDNAATLDSVVMHEENNQDYINGNPDFANRYYWVITKDGNCSQKTYYNAPSGVQAMATKSEFYTELYPNPATDYVNVEVTGLQSGMLNVALMDITGKTIRTTELVNAKAQVYIGDIVPGVYSVVYYHNGARIGVAKLVKN